MEVKVFQGDITTCEADVIAHQVNCYFVMGAGVALAIRRKWPKVYEQYRELGKTTKNKNYEWLGTCQLVDIDQNRYVANLFGQEECGAGRQFTEYDALENALRELKWHVNYMGLKTVAFPWGIGCGLAGGDWNIVKPMIENVFENTEVEIQYWKY
jgi:O-acetyl-ADP-ribose deacetylase (regulator of RNase III)